MREVLAKLQRGARLSWEELQVRPLPDGVDPLQLENHLLEEEFEVSEVRFRVIRVVLVTDVERLRGVGSLRYPVYSV